MLNHEHASEQVVGMLCHLNSRNFPPKREYAMDLERVLLLADDTIVPYAYAMFRFHYHKAYTGVRGSIRKTKKF